MKERFVCSKPKWSRSRRFAVPLVGLRTRLRLRTTERITLPSSHLLKAIAMPVRLLFACSLVVALAISAAADEKESKSEKPKFYDPVQREVEGWKVKVEPRLLEEEHQEVAAKAFTALANHLQRVKYIVPEEQLAKLLELPIWLELNNEKLGNMQYHPDRGWLLANGHDPRLVKHVHLPRAAELYDRHMWAKHPYVVLHELAHSYHDQVLSFDNAKIVSAFNEAKSKGIYDNVLLFNGQKVKHYALSNHKEYFAESTEAYFGVNDFYPFVRAELKEHDPSMYSLMEEFWGQVK